MAVSSRAEADTEGEEDDSGTRTTSGCEEKKGRVEIASASGGGGKDAFVPVSTALWSL